MRLSSYLVDLAVVLVVFVDGLLEGCGDAQPRELIQDLRRKMVGQHFFVEWPHTDKK